MRSKRGKASHGQKSKQVCLRIPVSVYEELQDISCQAKCSLSAVIVHALREFVKQR